MVTIDIPAEMAPHIQRLQADQNDYAANKAVASFLGSKQETFPHSTEFFERALAQNRTDDPDHKDMLQAYSEVLIFAGEFEKALKPLRVLLASY